MNTPNSDTEKAFIELNERKGKTFSNVDALLDELDSSMYSIFRANSFKKDYKKLNVQEKEALKNVIRDLAEQTTIYWNLHLYKPVIILNYSGSIK
ncbi:hypothetical protein [Sulfurovum sp.]|jgi:hypothetical protein|uniref:hypothetical protein n=1 Tax=Sulfurovum sp. TaxID=1969726 RepID=UPI0025E24819|nr:hypothetical protein [Sulfurovum sp.]